MQDPRVIADSRTDFSPPSLHSPYAHTSIPPSPDPRLQTSPASETIHPTPYTLNPARKSRAKRHLPWEQIELESHGLYAENLCALAKRFPQLSPMELRICALIKGMLKSWEIAERLRISEETVENHRIRIRRKLGLGKENLLRFLVEN